MIENVINICILVNRHLFALVNIYGKKHVRKIHGMNHFNYPLPFKYLKKSFKKFMLINIFFKNNIKIHIQ